jgi:hypothetical protein
MINDTTSITRLLTRKSQERNGDLLGHYIGGKKPQKSQEKYRSILNAVSLDYILRIITNILT